MQVQKTPVLHSSCRGRGNILRRGLHDGHTRHFHRGSVCARWRTPLHLFNTRRSEATAWTPAAAPLHLNAPTTPSFVRCAGSVVYRPSRHDVWRHVTAQVALFFNSLQSFAPHRLLLEIRHEPHGGCRSSTVSLRSAQIVGSGLASRNLVERCLHTQPVLPCTADSFHMKLGTIRV